MSIKRTVIGLSLTAVAVAGVILLLLAIRYKPYSKPVFNLDPAQVEEASMQSGMTGYYIKYSDPEDKRDFIERLNQIRYKNWVPASIGISDGWSYMINLVIDGVGYAYEFNDSHVQVGRRVYNLKDDELSDLTKLIQYNDSDSWHK